MFDQHDCFSMKITLSIKQILEWTSIYRTESSYVEPQQIVLQYLYDSYDTYTCLLLLNLKYVYKS